MKLGKHRFKRQESWRLHRVGESWRRPRGVTSRMRKEKAGWPARAKNGFGSASSTRGLHPRGLVEKNIARLSDLEGLDPRLNIVRLSRSLGERKRLLLLERVRQLNFRVANPGKGEIAPSEQEVPTRQEGAEQIEVAGQREDESEGVSEQDATPLSEEEASSSEESK